MGELVGENREDVEVRARPSQRRHRIEDAGHGAHATGVGAEPVVHLGIAVDGYAHEEVMLSEKCRPGVVDNVAVRLNGEVDRLPGAMLVDVGAERPEEIESRTRGFAALERKGHLGIVSKPKSAVDDCLIGCCIHDAMVWRLSMLRHVGVKAVAAPHIAGGTGGFDKKRDVLHGSSRLVHAVRRRGWHGEANV